MKYQESINYKRAHRDGSRHRELRIRISRHVHDSGIGRQLEPQADVVRRRGEHERREVHRRGARRMGLAQELRRCLPEASDLVFDRRARHRLCDLVEADTPFVGQVVEYVRCTHGFRSCGRKRDGCIHRRL